jgi:hypothetical protein
VPVRKLAASISNRDQLSDGTNFGSFSSHIILQPENARSASAQTQYLRLVQFVTVESLISGL